MAKDVFDIVIYGWPRLPETTQSGDSSGDANDPIMDGVC